MKDIHPIQLQILQTLLFKPQARFSDLNNTDLTNDHFTFHLRHLLTKKLIEKKEEGYALTSLGMEIAGRIDTDNTKIVEQPKIGVSACVIKDVGGVKHVLLNKRLKNQALGQVGLHTEKVRIGEKLTETLNRCITREVGGIQYDSEFMGISHAIVRENDELSLDVILHCFLVRYHSGEVVPATKEGENMWVEVNKVKSVNNMMNGVTEVINNSVQGISFFIENR